MVSSSSPSSIDRWRFVCLVSERKARKKEEVGRERRGGQGRGESCERGRRPSPESKMTKTSRAPIKPLRACSLSPLPSTSCSARRLCPSREGNDEPGPGEGAGKGKHEGVGWRRRGAREPRHGKRAAAAAATLAPLSFSPSSSPYYTARLQVFCAPSARTRRDAFVGQESRTVRVC